MASNVTYHKAEDLPEVIPVFPLRAALLLPRGEMPLNIFEPRYLAMIEDAIRGDRIIGMIQPDPETDDDDRPDLVRIGCAGRLTAFGETGDGRYLVTLTGVSRFRIVEELGVGTPYRQVKANFAEFALDLAPGEGQDEVDREALLKTLKDYLTANSLEADWDGIRRAPNEALVNALAMMSPFGPREKQALLEAADLKSRAEILVAVTEMDLARARGDASSSLQ
ncbi:LON peptidase substrate-binding domain-containing protein [Chenggangzhangella methanolivorans]|uniref:LON peptidase substrate-binding domain-containing protein n=1 Tax=Chenggangzhangella methanolivorans TaxID=1437009 RepID=A0A9E6RDW3_9HYPH|nr:LON peptidase substrate-binding domain-containing protein [Chenggangzhangella methanolivorans]QZO01573.1 LON peptidase substrate-binding domain-containing protein [Chenggangzhangella methanolivorans]